MKKHLGLGFVLCVLSYCAIADIDSTSGEYAEGNPIVINGSGFGSHSLNTDYLGRKSDHFGTGEHESA